MKRLFSASLQIVAVMIAFFAFSGSASAAAPGTPLSFTARVLDGTKYVYIEWKSNQENGAGKADGYKLFMASGKTDDPKNFKNIATIKDATVYKIKDLNSGDYTFYLTAYNADGESNRTDYRMVTVPGANNDVTIKFVSEPVKTGTSGKEYIYKSIAVSSISSSTVNYKLDSGAPDGMTIDEKTGVVTWTPTKDGVYKYTIIAYHADRSDIKPATQTIEVKVGAGQDNSLKFITEPKREVASGGEFVYEPKVISNDPNLQVLFKLDYSPEGMTIDEKTGRITWTAVKDGEYKVMLTAYVPGTTMKITQTFVIVVGKGNSGGDKSAVKFITKPVEYGCIGKEYTYDAEAVSAVASLLPLSYKLVYGPDGMTIDEKTGLINWTPSAQGEYKVSIWAGSGNDAATSATQTFTLKVKENCEIPPAPCASIYGQVVDETGVVINSGYVKAIRLDKASSGEASFGGKIVQGKYSVSVVEGSYALYVTGEELMGEWYQDAESVDKATPVVITCKTETQADFVVVRREKAKNVVIEGSVKNANGEAVYAMVEFIVKDKNGADVKEYNGRFVAKTDDKGNFRIEIPQNLIVIAHAIAKGTDKYLDQYYKGVTNPEEATRITVGDNQVIDFVLTERSVYNNGFGGRVRDTANAGLMTRVIAYRYVAASGKEPSKYEARTVETNASGEYNFTNITPGEYILFASPKEKTGYAPGYYKAGDMAATKWQDATVITVGNEVLSQKFDIILRASYGKKGGAHLGGKVTRKSGGISKGNSPLADAPLAGAMMIAVDANGTITDYLFSDDQGKFDFTELTQGTFTLSADKPGFAASTSTFAVDYAAKASVITSIVMVEQQGASSVDEGTVENSGVSVYPNPASGTVTVAVESLAGVANVSVVNTIGSEVARFESAMSSGMNLLSFDSASLPTGMYLIRIQTGAVVRTVSLRIVR